MPLISIYYFCEFFASAAFNGFITLFYRARGMTLGRVSLLMAIAPLTAFAALPLWGTISDHAPRKNVVHVTVIFLSALSVLLFEPADTFLALAWVSCLFAFFSTVITPLGETVALEYLHQHRLPFGPCRLFGALAYALGGLILGFLLQGHEERFVPACAIVYALCAASALALPTVHGHARSENSKPLLTYDGLQYARTSYLRSHRKGSFSLQNSAYAFLLHHDLAPMLLFALCIQVTQGIFYTLYAPYLTDVLGASRRMVGVAIALGALCEIPFLRVSDKLYRMLSAPWLLLLCGTAMALHWLLLGLLPYRWAAVALQAMNILGTTAAAFTMAQHISRHTPAAQKARAQTLLYLVTYAAARTLGSVLGGFFQFITRSIPSAFIISGILLLCCCALFARLMLQRPQPNRRRY